MKWKERGQLVAKKAKARPEQRHSQPSARGPPAAQSSSHGRLRRPRNCTQGCVPWGFPVVRGGDLGRVGASSYPQQRNHKACRLSLAGTNDRMMIVSDHPIFTCILQLHIAGSGDSPCLSQWPSGPYTNTCRSSAHHTASTSTQAIAEELTE
jgi:hypothetical protein